MDSGYRELSAVGGRPPCSAAEPGLGAAAEDQPLPPGSKPARPGTKNRYPGQPPRPIVGRISASLLFRRTALKLAKRYTTMHEMSLCEGVLEVLEDNARSQHYARVKTVWLEIGRFAGVEVEAMRFCFDAVCRGTLAQGAKLEIIEVPGRAWCMQCSRTVTLEQRYDPCPNCGGYQLQPTGGDELRIKELEVD